MRGKQYLVALRAQEQVLMLHTLHGADEVRDPHQELPVLPSRGDAQGKEIVSEEAPPEVTNVIDLMEALQRSVEQSRGSRGKAPEERRDKKTAARKPAGKVAAKTTSRKQASTSATAGGRDKGRRELRQLSKAEPYQRASDQGIPGRSKMSHDELADALTRAGRRRKKKAA
ncbi:hypothetical protein GCM10010246_01980 [Streptomyces cuspidosporus]|uniref:Ku domain-containing protein n=2 Tax=Streptomyces cuspidosporus TaxID=66882 RepID=A0ABN3F9I4_9ACTN